jgi:hypothetical protein
MVPLNTAARALPAEPQHYVSLKAALGHDFAFNGFVLSP